jgi:hypothetical protein
MLEQSQFRSLALDNSQGCAGVLIQESDTEKAVFLLERAVALDPHNKLAHKNAADLLARKQVPASA